MKHTLFRLIAVLAVLAILLLAIPSTAALAVASITVNPNPAKVGQVVTVSGAGYGTSAQDDQYYVDIYLTNQTATAGSIIDSTITTYKLVINGEFLDMAGSFDGPLTFVMPTALDEGAGGTVTPVTLTPSMSLYVCVTIRNLATNVNNPPKNILVVTTLSVAQGASITLTPATGAPGTAVQVRGGNFPASNALSFTLGGNAITPTSGDVSTDTFGTFISTITIPAGTAAGAMVVVATAGSTSISATFTVTAPAVPPALTLSPASGIPGTQVAMTGTNFAAGTLSVFFDSTTPVPITGGSTATSGGTFASFISVPATATVGAHIVTVTVVGTTSSASANFTVTGTTTTPPTTTTNTTTPTQTTTAPPSTGALNIVSNSKYVGATIGISGTGFKPGATVAITYDGTPVATATVDANSTFIAPFFTAPPGKVGVHTIIATDSTGISAKTTFTIQQAIPSVPLPMTPLNGATVKSPVTFTWGTANSNNAPVVYRLQIASDRTFPASSVLIDHGNITTTSYILSDAELAKLTSTTLPYYWRIESVDAASTESGWTGAGTIYVKGPVVMPKWAYWAIGAGIALVFFLIGLWIGRRTAFYY